MEDESKSRMWIDKEKGGFRASTFVYALVALENMGFVANMVSLVLYFMFVLFFDSSGSANTLTNFMGSTFLLTTIGGFISDTYINRFWTCIIFGTLELLAYVLMTIQARMDSLRPKLPCGKSSCLEGREAWIFYASLCLLALGAGGVRGAFPALGADQFDQKDPKEVKALASYFNWLLLSTVFGGAVGCTFLVYISTKPDNKHWWIGFLISLIGAFVGLMFLALGKPFYRLQIDRQNTPILRVLQVIVVAIKNRKLNLPDSPDELHAISAKESVTEKLSHTKQFRCLDKAAILAEKAQPVPWTVCTVTQVEEVKVLTRMLPIIASTILMNTCLAQLQTFSVQQGFVMDRLLGSFLAPAPSVPVIPLGFMCILIPLYEFIFVPFARKITKHPSGITQLQRVGVGLVLSAVSMAVAGIIEVKRRNHSLINPLKPISVFWLSFQYGIFGIADMFTLVGLLEFFYKEAPAGMRSLSTSFTFISMSIGYFLSTVLVDIVNAITKKVTPSKQSWLHGDNLDFMNLNLFYWFLAILSVLNFLNYLYWASWYKYRSEDGYKASSISSISKSKPASQAPFLKADNDDGSMATTNVATSVDDQDEKSIVKN